MLFDLFSSVDYCFSSFYFSSVSWFLGVSFMFPFFFFFFWGGGVNSLIYMLMGYCYSGLSFQWVGCYKGYSRFILGLFMVFFGVNVWGLVPYVFGLSTQVVYSLGFSLVIWLTMVFSSLVYSPVIQVGHWTPFGAPLWLVPLLNLMEVVSMMVRPFTLSLRLSMNMTTGHMFMTLMGTIMTMAYFKGLSFYLVFMLLVCSGYFLFEMVMCLIQSFVFCLLSSQYLGEHA